MGFTVFSFRFVLRFNTLVSRGRKKSYLFMPFSVSLCRGPSAIPFRNAFVRVLHNHITKTVRTTLNFVLNSYYCNVRLYRFATKKRQMFINVPVTLERIIQIEYVLEI